jgi:putative restriction endonuclease
VSAIDLDVLLSILSRLRRATVGARRGPHKPLLLLWLLARFQQVGTSAVTYSDLEQPVSDLINEFGPPVVSLAAAGQRAAMPFVHLERELWNVVTANDEPLSPDTPERRRALVDLGARSGAVSC